MPFEVTKLNVDWLVISSYNIWSYYWRKLIGLCLPVRHLGCVYIYSAVSHKTPKSGYQSQESLFRRLFPKRSPLSLFNLIVYSITIYKQRYYATNYTASAHFRHNLFNFCKIPQSQMDSHFDWSFDVCVPSTILSSVLQKCKCNET